MHRILGITARAVLILFAAQLSADELRPVTHEDVWTMSRLGTPAISPDGQSAVVSVTEPSYEEDGDVSNLWLIDVGGENEPRRLTATKAGESGVAWRPDGGAIAFSAKRGDDEVSQVYVLDMTGPGEAVAVTSLSTGASSPAWSPDGSKIAFQSKVFPGAADDEANQEEKKAREERKYNVSAYNIFPIRQWDNWRDDKQVHLFVQDAVAGAEATDLLAGSELVDMPGFQGTPSLSGNDLNAAWTPDGKRLLFNATVNLDQAAHASVVYHLYSVSLEGGDPKKVTDSTDWSCTSPEFSADGKLLFCSVSPENELVYNHNEIGRFKWKRRGMLGEPELLTAGFDRSPDGIELSDDGETVYFTAADAGRSRVFSVPSAGGDVRMLDPDSRGVYAGIQAAGGQLVARWESSASPAEVVRVNPQGGHETLSPFNVERAVGLDMPAFREFWFESSKGRRVHSWLALPPGFDEKKKYPLVLQIHGGPFSSSMDAGHVRWDALLLASPGYVVLMTDYTGSVGYGEQFSRNIVGDPLKTPGEEVVEAANAAIELFSFIDGDRQAATGASYGGHLINWLQGTTDHFKALVGHAGLVDLEGQYSSSDVIYHRELMNGGPPWDGSAVWKEQSPSSYADRFSTPILLTIGEKDYRVPVNQTIAAWSYVQRQQVPGRLLVFHDANHWIMKGEEAKYFWQEVHDWLARHL